MGPPLLHMMVVSDPHPLLHAFEIICLGTAESYQQGTGTWFLPWTCDQIPSEQCPGNDNP
jgi:hypothetical protein